MGYLADVAGAPISEEFSVPVALGDLAIMSVSVGVELVTTVPAASTSVRGVRVTVTSSDGASVVDVVGSAEFLQVNDGAVTIGYDAFVDPQALCLLRNNERVRVTAPEMDSNASPTGDLRIRVKAVRVRPLEGAVSGPIRLVS